MFAPQWWRSKLIFFFCGFPREVLPDNPEESKGVPADIESRASTPSSGAVWIFHRKTRMLGSQQNVDSSAVCALSQIIITWTSMVRQHSCSFSTLNLSFNAFQIKRFFSFYLKRRQNRKVWQVLKCLNVLTPKQTAVQTRKSEFIFNHAASPPLFSAQKKMTTMTTNPMRTWHQ